MASTVVSVPQDAIVHMLRGLPEDVLVDIFWRAFTEVDSSPVTSSERTEIEKADEEFQRGETVKWEDIR